MEHDDDRAVAEALCLLGAARGTIERAAKLLARAGLEIAGGEGHRLSGYLDGLVAHVAEIEAKHQAAQALDAKRR